MDRDGTDALLLRKNPQNAANAASGAGAGKPYRFRRFRAALSKGKPLDHSSRRYVCNFHLL